MASLPPAEALRAISWLAQQNNSQLLPSIVTIANSLMAPTSGDLREQKTVSAVKAAAVAPAPRAKAPPAATKASKKPRLAPGIYTESSSESDEELPPTPKKRGRKTIKPQLTVSIDTLAEVASKEPISGAKRARSADIGPPRKDAAKKPAARMDSATFDEFVSAIKQHADDAAELEGFSLESGQYISVGMRGQGEALSFSSIAKAANYVGCTPEVMQLNVEGTDERYPWRTGRLQVWVASGELPTDTSGDKGTPSTALMEAISMVSTPNTHAVKIWSPVSGGREAEPGPHYELDDALTETEEGNESEDEPAAKRGRPKSDKPSHNCRARPFLITEDGAQPVLFPSTIKAAKFIGVTTKTLLSKVEAGRTRFHNKFTVVLATKARTEVGSAQASPLG